LTGFPHRRYDPSRAGGGPIPDSEENVDFERLERAVTALVEFTRRQRDENGVLRRKLEERTRRIRHLEGQLLEANQLRQDVAKRIDELIVQITHLESELDERNG
jgi:septal ring factor EnvC (AmiA/AmiB activator)